MLMRLQPDSTDLTLSVVDVGADAFAAQLMVIARGVGGAGLASVVYECRDVLEVLFTAARAGQGRAPAASLDARNIQQTRIVRCFM